MGPTCRRCFSRTRACSLSVPRTPPVSPSLTSRPRPSPWTHPRPCVRRPPPHALAPLDLMPRSPTFPRSLAPSAELSHPLSRPARATRQAPPLLTEDRRRFATDVEPAAPIPSLSSAASPAARDTLRFVLSLSSLPGPRSPEHFLRSRSPPQSTRDFTASLPSSRRS
jgi:hypothetical protein